MAQYQYGQHSNNQNFVLLLLDYKLLIVIAKNNYVVPIPIPHTNR